MTPGAGGPVNLSDLNPEELGLLLRLGERLVSELDLDNVLALVAEAACQVVQAETLALPFIDPDQKTFTYRAASGKYASLLIGQTFAIDEGACGWVLQHQRPLLFGEGGSFDLNAAARWQPGAGSSLLVPLICRGSIIGGLSAMARSDGGPFTLRDQTVLTLFANQAGIAIDNARLFQNMEIERKRLAAAAEAIEELAFFDPLTGLPNRRLLLDRLRQALVSSARDGHCGALLFIDLDNFKMLNDTLGHDVGDLLLREVAKRLGTCVREGDTVARFGGDEFVVVLPGLSDNPEQAANQAELVAGKITAALSRAYVLGSRHHRSTQSIGVTLFGEGRETLDDLLRRADLAMYQAKGAGRNTVRFFDPKMQAAVTARAALEVDLYNGLQHGQFMLHYQAQVDGHGVVTGVEALARWRHPERGLVSPADFIPLAEETGLILPLGLRLLDEACARLVNWAARPEFAHLTMAINVSARQFRHPEFVDQVLAALEASGANPEKLSLELTESLLLEDVDGVIAKMAALTAHGVSFALDDFGTGYSSLAYLKRLPLHHLKIDRSFVRDILTDPNDTAIARTIVALARSMGMGVIAEGVETEEQRECLAELGCHACQGFLFSRPAAAEEFERTLLAAN